jgi:hypothetical protein
LANRARIEQIAMGQNLRDHWRPLGFIVGNTDRECRKVTGLTGDRKTLTDAKLKHLENQPQLVWLDLRGTGTTDVGLVHLKQLKSLRVLRLEGTQITDAGIPHLKTLTNLRILELDGTQVTDAAQRPVTSKEIYR